MFNHEILDMLRTIHQTNELAFSDSKQTIAMLKDLCMNNQKCNAIVRWLGISLSDFDAFHKMENDFKNNCEFARRSLVNDLIGEGASVDIANDVAECWEILVIVKLASSGNAQAQWNMGNFYIVGAGGVEKNLDMAVYWFEKSARQGYGDAVFNLGQVYLMLDRYDDALCWLEKANKGGHPEAGEYVEMARMLKTRG